MNSSNNVVSLAGRILLSAIFIFSGIGKIAAFSMYTPAMRERICRCRR